MTTPELESSWAPFNGLVPFQTVLAAIAKPLEVCGETLVAIVPSIEIGPGGPFVQAIFLTTTTIIAEVRLGGSGEHFDFARRMTVKNYRIALDQHTVKREGAEDIVYETASIYLHHGSDRLISEINFVGTTPEERDNWLKAVLGACRAMGHWVCGSPAS